MEFLSFLDTNLAFALGVYNLKFSGYALAQESLFYIMLDTYNKNLLSKYHLPETAFFKISLF